MTLPVFTPIPVPARDWLANEPPPATQQAVTLDANFSSLNGYLGSGLRRSLTWGGSTPGVVYTDVVADGLWHYYWTWEGFSFTVPSNVGGYLLWLDVTINPTHNYFMSFSPGFSGSGVVGTGPDLVVSLQPGANTIGNAAQSVIAPPGALLAGGTVNVSMRYLAGQSGAMYIAGTFGIVAL